MKMRRLVVFAAMILGCQQALAYDTSIRVVGLYGGCASCISSVPTLIEQIHLVMRFGGNLVGVDLRK
jgi:hypothetical protein